MSLEHYPDLLEMTKLDPKLGRAARSLVNQGVKAFGFTDTLQGKLMQDMVEDRQKAIEMLFMTFHQLIAYMTHLKKFEKGPKRAMESYKLVEAALSRKDKGPEKYESSCRKGCSACCHVQPFITDSEADIITSYVRSNNISIDLERLKKQAAIGPSHDYARALSWEDSACVLLGSDGTCQVYKVRPNVCRKHSVTGDPKNCDVRISEYSKLLIDNYAEIIASALLNLETNDEGASIPLPELLLARLH